MKKSTTFSASFTYDWEGGLYDNPYPRQPVVIIADGSGSMAGKPVEQENLGIAQYFSSIGADLEACESVETAIVVIDSEPQVIQGFKSFDEGYQPPKIKASGTTPLGEAAKLSLDMLDGRKKLYKSQGIEYYQPWLLLMTDGCLYDGDPKILKEQQARTRKLVADRKLNLINVGIGESADMDSLKAFSPVGKAYCLDGLRFDKLFQWLSQSVSNPSFDLTPDMAMPWEAI